MGLPGDFFRGLFLSVLNIDIRRDRDETAGDSTSTIVYSDELSDDGVWGFRSGR